MPEREAAAMAARLPGRVNQPQSERILRPGWHADCERTPDVFTPTTESKNATRGVDGKNSRHQTREGLELEIHLWRDRRLLADADHGGAPGANEADEAAGGDGRAAVRLEQNRRGAAQRSPLSGLIAGGRPDGSSDLPLLRARDGVRHDLEGADPGGVRG